MNPTQFSKIAESLRQYRRADLSEFASDVGGTPLERMYVDPLPSDAILNSVLTYSTTFLLGRKGTGKSTIFAKAQSEIRKRRDAISVYIDVKSLSELATSAADTIDDTVESQLPMAVITAHLLRKHFLSRVVEELLTELRIACDSLSLVERWTGRKRGYQELMQALDKLKEKLRTPALRTEEIPILTRITSKARERKESQAASSGTATTTAGVEGIKSKLNTSLEAKDFSKSLEDNDLYQEYSDIVLRSFPFSDLIREIADLLDEAGLARLVVFFDDFSELEWTIQRLFVDVVLAPLNNASNERIKLKVAGYPGRVYYGRIDPGKVDTISLDFSALFKVNDIQSAEAAATEYTKRLLEARFTAFGAKLEDYFDPSVSLDEHMNVMFQASSNVPRLTGYILHYCYLERVSKRLVVTTTSIRSGAAKYYSAVVSQYFDRAGRFALEPFERKLDRHNQRKLLNELIKHAARVRRQISAGEVGGAYFSAVKNAPVSHFAVDPSLDGVLASLEFNFLVTRYSEIRDKDGKDQIVYALFLGLCEAERFSSWGYPKGREYRNYFSQRCFDFNPIIRSFLSATRTIRCGECGACFSMDDEEKLRFYHWRCPECTTGTCEVVQLGDEFTAEVAMLDQRVMLEEVELNILETLNAERRAMKASEISLLLDVTYQLVGRRTAKLQDKGLVSKQKDAEGTVRSKIQATARDIYFADK